MKLHLIKISLVCLLVFAACSLDAQQFTGRVTDPTGAVVPKVTVVAHNVDTGVDIKATTNQTGSYTIPYLHAGNYTVSAETKGFRRGVREGINLQVGETSVVDFQLQVGSETTTITVTGDTLLDLGKADQGEVVENARVMELPLNGRDPILLAALTAGVNNSNSFGYQRPFDDNAQNLSANGGGNGNVEMLLDGTSNNDSPINVTGGPTEGVAKTAYTTPVDSVQEFKVVTSPYDAQYGLMAGGVEDVILKSGTNRLHGDIYEYARRTWMNANTWKNDWAKATAKPGTDLNQFRKANSKWDQYGFELDGPVSIPKLYDGKNKTFFTMQWEHFHQFAPLTDTASVPDPAWADGDFSTLDRWNGSGYTPMQIYDPLTGVYNASNNTWVRQQFPGNKIPVSRIDPLAQRILKMYPKPNVTVTTGRNHTSQNYVLSTAGEDTYNNLLAKLDHNFSAKDRFTLRYGYWMRNTTYNGNGMPPPLSQGQVPIVARAHTFATEETHTFTPNLLLDFKANVIVRLDLQRTGSAFDPTAFWSQDQVNSMGPAARAEFPQICWQDSPYGCYFSSYTTIGSTGNNEAVKNSMNLLPTMTWIKGTHTIRGGLDMRFWQNGYANLNGGPTINTGSSWTYQTANHAVNSNQNDGNAFASFILGVPYAASVQIWPQTYQSQHYVAPFVQDDWKVSKRLTLNLGLRWDFIPGETERHNKGNYAFDALSVNPALVGVFVPGHGALTGGLTFVGVDGNPRSSYKMILANYQPRVGFAYQLNDKTVLRGGFGKSMRTPQNGIPVNGFSAHTDAVTSDPNYVGGVFPNMQNRLENLFWGGVTGSVLQPSGSSLGLGTNLGQGVSFLNPDYKTPSFWNYSLGFQRQLSKFSSLNVSYVGSRLYDGDSSANINMQDQAQRAACNPMLGGNPNTCDNKTVANPFKGVNAFAGSSYKTNSTLNFLDITRPMPQFADVTENLLNDARSWYNALQVTALYRVSNSLTLHGTETWSKTMTAGTWADQYYGIRNRTLDGSDMPHRITVSGVYQLPVGRGRMLLSNANRLADAAVGGWEFSSMFIWQSGTPQSVPGYYLHKAKVKRHVDSFGNIRVFAPYAEHYVLSNGQYVVQPYEGNGTHYNYDGVNTGVINFMDVPKYAPAAMTEFSGIRTAGMRQFDTSLAKNFAIVENLKLQVRVDAFNVLNHPEWLMGASTSTNDANLGAINKGPTGPSNNPRGCQFSAKLMW